ncbi:TPA: DUF3265 domain-containing protein [Vibrio vulnificus]|nr:DUF3265 domain-containing protein [Vibrio vulnificus]HDY8100335.1 DUF3265 domain-containing protein [Vibrio vulnificus]
MGITNALRRIRNAWHFYHALISVIKVVCGNIVLRCSPLKRALCLLGEIHDYPKAFQALWLRAKLLFC